MSTPDADLREQWGNPRDILSLLLLLGGDIVQKAAAQLVGYQVRPFGQHGPGLSIAPVAFSFGWVAYGFSSLLAAFGDMALMPACDHPCILVNCATGFARENRSWVLGRLLRDHEIRHGVDPRPLEEGGRAESLRVDVFELSAHESPSLDLVWWLGWVTLLLQVVIAIVPWVVYGDWTVTLVTFSGSFLALITCAMPQWIQEKWASGRVKKHNVTCLTRGNGSHHIMVFVASQGAWDFETLAAGSSFTRPETRGMLLVLLVFWICLLVTVSGITSHTWYLVCIGGIGMLQNLFAAASPRVPETSKFHLQRSSRALAIVGLRQPYKEEADAEVNFKETEDGLAELTLWASESAGARQEMKVAGNGEKGNLMPRWLESMSREDGVPDWLEPVHPTVVAAEASVPQSIISTLSSLAGKSGNKVGSTEDKVVNVAGGVHGALIELEKRVPTAGLAMLEVFFPRGPGYSDEAVRDNVHKTFWRRAYHTKNTRLKAEAKRRQQYQAATVDSASFPK